MKKNISILILLIISININSEETTLKKEIINSCNKFTVDLYTQMKNEEGNILFSPFSIYTVFSMLYAGAEGKTRQEIKDTMYFNDKEEVHHKAFQSTLEDLNELNSSEYITIEINNSFWPDSELPFLQSYINLLDEIYDTEIIPMDYGKPDNGAKDKINSWIANRTNGLIKDILKYELNENAKWILVNTIYFKGSWQNMFNIENTKKLSFITDKEEILTPMMNQINAFEFGKFDDVQCIKLPYKDNNLSMYIILPNEQHGLSEIENNLSIENINKWSKSLYYRDIELYLPKFKYFYDLKKIKEYLVNLGIINAFDKKNADFSRIDGYMNNLYIDILKHNAAIEVNEEGSEAAAATVVGCFPAGTLIHTDNGLLPIEDLKINDYVKSYNLVSEDWEISTLTNAEKFNYKGDMITIKVNNEIMTMTGTQPIYVLKGRDLINRPKPKELKNDKNIDIGKGRWIEARDLKVGDTLISIKNGEVKITDVSSENDELEVYYLSVEKNNNHAFNRIGILAHNNGSKESAGPSIMNINQPFIYFIKDEINGSILFMGRVSNPLGK